MPALDGGGGRAADGPAAARPLRAGPELSPWKRRGADAPRLPPPAAWSPAPPRSPLARATRGSARQAPGEARAGEGAPGEGGRQPLVHGRRPPARPVARRCADEASGRSRSRCGPPGPTGCARGSAATGSRAGAAVRLAAAATSAAAVVVHAWQPAPTEWSAARGPPASAAGRTPRRSSSAIERMRFALGVDEDLTRVRARVPRRSADRRGDPPPALAAAEAAAVALGGARLGGHRAADRGAPCGRDPAPHRPPLGRRGCNRATSGAWRGPRTAARRARRRP